VKTLLCKSSIVFFLLCVFASAGYYIAVYHILPYSSIRPHRITREEKTLLYSGHYDPSTFNLKFENLDVLVEDSITLRGWFIHAKGNTGVATIILLHGIANCKESLLGFADTLAQLGYNCILYDARAHGESGGSNCTYGFYEKHDVSAYIDKATKEYAHVGPIAIYGNSFGAAVALQAMAGDKRIRCGIVECSFATLREVAYDYWKRLSHLPIHFIPDAALKNSEKIANFPVDSVKPEESAKQIDCPVLIAHGDQDKNISWEYGMRVFRNIKSPAKEWYLVHGAGHYDVPKVGGSAYFNILIKFLEVHTSK
jgi:uncharacterized protein